MSYIRMTPVGEEQLTSTIPVTNLKGLSRTEERYPFLEKNSFNTRANYFKKRSTVHMADALAFSPWFRFSLIREDSISVTLSLNRFML